MAIIEAEALLAQYQAEYQALVNAAYEAEKAFELEQAMAAAEAAKAAAELEAQKAAAQLELDLLDIQTQIIEAQAAYEVAMKELAAAKVALSPAQVAYLAPFKYDVAVAQLEVDNLATQLETAAENLAAAIATVDKNKADKLAIRTAELDVVAKEAALLGAQEAVEIAKAALELDPKVTDWVAEKAELEAEYDAMEKAKLEALLETEDKNAELEAKYNELHDAYLEYTAATGFSFNEETGEFSVVPGFKTPLTAPEIYVPSPKDEDGNNLFGYGYDDFHAAAPKFEYGNADAYGVVSAFDGLIMDYGNIHNEYYDANIRVSEAVIEGLLKNSEEEFAEYEAAVAAYESDDYLAYYNEYAAYASDETFVLADVVDEYNTALKAWRAAAVNYKTEYQKYVFDNEAYWEKIAELDEIRLAAYAKADADFYPGLQAADNKRFTAQNTHQKAYLAYTRALAAEATEIAAILDDCQKPDTTTIRTDLEAMVGLTLTDEQKVVYNKLKAANDRVKEIRAARKTADETWAKAEETWTKAEAEYTKTTTDLGNALSDA